VLARLFLLYAFVWSGGALADFPAPETWPASERTGAICIGRDLSPMLPNPKLMIGVDQGARIPVGPNAGKIAFRGLDLRRPHRVTFYDDDIPLASWTIRFRESNLFFVWKAYGAWKSKPIGNGVCTETGSH
jgi:hypothetical protein